MSSNPKKQPALGRGLSALLQNSETDITSMNGATVGSVSMINIQHIEANPFNPRTHFEKEALEELRMSILTHGIIQPLTVRKLGRDRFQLISGERRFRASQLAGLTEVPAYIRIANDQTMLEMALVENIQREDLNAIEVAISYERLLDECKLTQEQLSEKVAKSRSSIANHIRLLKLPASIQAGVRDQKISMGHARALLSITDEQEQLNAYQQIIDEALSVRAVELMVKPASNPGQTTAKKPKIGLSNTEQVFTAFLSDKLGAKVSIDKTDSGKGKVQVHFSTEAELNRVMALLKK
jgi:ParB family chromosome partitioning protein